MPPKKNQQRAEPSVLDNQTICVDVKCLSIIVQRMRHIFDTLSKNPQNTPVKVQIGDFKHADIDLIAVEIGLPDCLTVPADEIRKQIHRSNSVKEQIDLTKKLNIIELYNKKSISYGFTPKHSFVNTLRLFAPLYVANNTMYVKAMEMFGKFSGSFTRDYGKVANEINITQCETLTDYGNMIISNIKQQTFDTYMDIINAACNKKYRSAEEHQINEIIAAYLNLVRYVSMYLRNTYKIETMLILSNAGKKSTLAGMLSVKIDQANVVTWLEELLPAKQKKSNIARDVENIINMALIYIATGILIPVDFEVGKTSFMSHGDSSLNYIISEYNKMQTNFSEYLATKIEY